MAAWSVITTSYGCWEIHTDSWLKFTPTIPKKKKKHVETSTWSPTNLPFLGFFWMDDQLIFLTVGCVPWNGRDTWKSKNPHCLPLITPIQVVCFNKHHTGVTRHIYIYIFIVYTYYIYIYIHSRLYMWYIYIYIRWDVPQTSKPMACLHEAHVLLPWSWGPMPCPIAPAQRSTAGLDLRPRLASWSRFTPGSSNREESGDHDESYTKPFAVFKGIPSKVVTITREW